MSDEPKKPETAPVETPKPPAAPSTSILGTIGVGGVASGLLGVLGAAAGAGWPGVVALLLVGLTVPFSWSFLVKIFNDWSDKRDLERAGSDAGDTSVDLAKQGRAVSHGLDAAESLDPPTEGFPPAKP